MGKEENTKLTKCPDAVTKYLRLDNLKRTEMHFSWFWSLGRPKSRHKRVTVR